MAPRKLSRAADALLVALFVAGIWLPLLGVRIGHHGWDIAARAENRHLADAPDLLRPGLMRLPLKARLKAALRFPGQFKYYLGEHFGFRSLLIRAHGLMMVRGLGVTSNSAVILGKEGWLYLGNDGSLEDWRNVDPFTPAQLEQWRQMLETRAAFCARRGIPYLFIVAPSKYDIYPQYMPDALNRAGNEDRLDQLLAYLREKQSAVRVLDLRQALLAGKSSGVRLFYKTDTHWNDRGAWIAYQAVMDAVRPLVPQARVLRDGEFEPVTRYRPGMDLAGLLGLNDVLWEQSLDLRPRIHLRLPHVEQNDVRPIRVEADAPDEPRALVFRDSFFTSVLPYLAESFGHGLYLWSDGFDRRLIESEHPDIVIQQIAQRKLMRPLRRVDGQWEIPPE